MSAANLAEHSADDGHGENAIPLQTSAMNSPSPDLSPAGGGEDQNESLRDFHVKTWSHELRCSAKRYISEKNFTALETAIVSTLAHGDRVVMIGDNSLPVVSLLLTLLSYSITPLFLAEESVVAERMRYASDIGARCILRLDSDCHLQMECLSIGLTNKVDDVGLYLLSSGSTGLPAVVFRSLSGWDLEARRYQDLLSLNARHHILIASPIYHAYSMGWLWAAIRAGSTLEMYKPTQLSKIVDALQQRATHCALTPFIASLLARRVGHGQRPTQLEVVMAGAGSVDATLETQFNAAFGLGLSRNYGSTESGALFGGLAPLPPLSIGYPLPNLTVVDADSAQPFLLKVELEDGCIYPTGDIVQRGEHGYYVLGRETTAIRRGESWISPFEIESVLRNHPAVEDCCVRAVKSSAGNDHILAAIVVRDGYTWDEVGTRQFCREQLGERKIPDVIQRVETIPRNANGKVHKSKVYRLASPERIATVANAYKLSTLLFALWETQVLERLDGQTSVDQIALAASLSASTLEEMLEIAKLNGLVDEVVAGTPTSNRMKTIPDEILDLVRLEKHASQQWNHVNGLSTILRRGRLHRPFAEQVPGKEFIQCYQTAMNGAHKKCSGQLAIRKLLTMRQGPFSLLDVSATSGAYSKRFGDKGILQQSHCLSVGGLTHDSEFIIANTTNTSSLEEIVGSEAEVDVLVLDNAIHHHSIAKNLLRLIDRLSTAGIVILDEIFIEHRDSAVVGVDWLTHGGIHFLSEESFDLLMLNLHFQKIDVLKVDTTVSHRLNLYART